MFDVMVHCTLKRCVMGAAALLSRLRSEQEGERLHHSTPSVAQASLDHAVVVPP
jgi:hypothetical protein